MLNSSPNENLISVPKWRRAVIKVGSALITPGGKLCSTKFLLPIAHLINTCHQQGQEIVLVSSGAVAAGKASFPNTNRHPHVSIPRKQAYSAVGQNMVMHTWSKLFDFPCGQVLMTQEDFSSRSRYVNAKNTLLELLRLGALPIVNENDTLATEELKVGDNDNIAALLAGLVEADLLVLLTDIDGLFKEDPRGNPHAELISHIEEITPGIYSSAGGATSSVGTGGMFTKIQAAEKAARAGINTLILNGEKPESFTGFLAGRVKGSLFNRQQNPMAAKKQWILHTLKTAGGITIDQGAVKALTLDSASLLPRGIVKIQGSFQPGDSVEILSQDGNKTIAKGLTQYASTDLEKIIGLHSSEIIHKLGYLPNHSVVHRQDLVII